MSEALDVDHRLTEVVRGLQGRRASEAIQRLPVAISVGELREWLAALAHRQAIDARKERCARTRAAMLASELQVLNRQLETEFYGKLVPGAMQPSDLLPEAMRAGCRTGAVATAASLVQGVAEFGDDTK